MWKKVKLLKMSNFTLFNNVFYGICILKSLNSHISVVVCSFFEFWTFSRWCIWKRVKHLLALGRGCDVSNPGVFSAFLWVRHFTTLALPIKQMKTVNQPTVTMCSRPPKISHDMSMKIKELITIENTFEYSMVKG